VFDCLKISSVQTLLWQAIWNIYVKVKPDWKLSELSTWYKKTAPSICICRSKKNLDVKYTRVKKLVSPIRGVTRNKPIKLKFLKWGRGTLEYNTWLKLVCAYGLWFRSPVLLMRLIDVQIYIHMCLYSYNLYILINFGCMFICIYIYIYLCVYVFVKLNKDLKAKLFYLLHMTETSKQSPLKNISY